MEALPFDIQIPSMASPFLTQARGIPSAGKAIHFPVVPKRTSSLSSAVLVRDRAYNHMP